MLVTLTLDELVSRERFGAVPLVQTNQYFRECCHVGRRVQIGISHGLNSWWRAPVVFLAAVLASAQPGRAGLGACQAASQQPVRRIQGRDEAARSGRLAPHPEAAKPGQVVLWAQRVPVRSDVTILFETLVSWQALQRGIPHRYPQAMVTQDTDMLSERLQKESRK